MGFGFRLFAPVMASPVTHPVAALSARSGNREAVAKGGSEAGAANALKDASRARADRMKPLMALFVGAC